MQKVNREPGSRFNVNSVFIDVMFNADALRHLLKLTVLFLKPLAVRQCRLFVICIPHASL